MLTCHCPIPPPSQVFDRLTVQAVKEVVSLGAPDWVSGGAGGALLPAGAPHADPAQFHALLEQAAADAQQQRCQAHGTGRANGGNAAPEQAPRGKETVLIDTRNFYESRIGRFEPVRFGRRMVGPSAKAPRPAGPLHPRWCCPAPSALSNTRLRCLSPAVLIILSCPPALLPDAAARGGGAGSRGALLL